MTSSTIANAVGESRPSTLDDRMPEIRAELADAKFPLDEAQAMTFIRAAYGKGYMDAHAAGDDGELAEVRRLEAEAWARLPVPPG